MHSCCKLSSGGACRAKQKGCNAKPKITARKAIAGKVIDDAEAAEADGSVIGTRSRDTPGAESDKDGRGPKRGADCVAEGRGSTARGGDSDENPARAPHTPEDAVARRRGSSGVAKGRGGSTVRGAADSVGDGTAGSSQRRDESPARSSRGATMGEGKDATGDSRGGAESEDESAAGGSRSAIASEDSARGSDCTIDGKGESVTDADGAESASNPAMNS